MIHSLRTSLQNSVLALGLATMLFACSKEEIFETPESAVASEKIALTFKAGKAFENGRIKEGVKACAEKKVNLIVGQQAGLGEVSVYKDASNKLYVTISIHDNDNAWFIAKSSLFIGAVPTSGIKKNPAPGQFPYAADIISANNTGDKEYTYIFDLNGQDKALAGKGSLDFAIHADLVRVKTDDAGSILFDSNGMAEIVQKEGGWGEGVRFTDKGSWAMYFNYDVDQVCASECNPVWTKLTGALTLPEKGALNDFTNISFPLFADNTTTVVGLVHLTYTPSQNGNVNTIFSLDNTKYPTLSFEEVAVKFSNSADITTDFSNVTKVTAPTLKDGQEVWLVEQKGASGTIYAAFYAKVDGVCPK